MKLGIISDTHGYLDPRIPEIFEGVQHILHGGDIGPPYVLQRLEAIAPVTAVLGNTDTPLPGIRESEFISLGETGFLLHHIVDPEKPGETVQRRLALNAPDVVIFGHTHRPFSRRIGNVLYFNPGYASRQRFDLRRSVALLQLNGREIREELVWL